MRDYFFTIDGDSTVRALIIHEDCCGVFIDPAKPVCYMIYKDSESRPSKITYLSRIEAAPLLNKFRVASHSKKESVRATR